MDIKAEEYLKHIPENCQIDPGMLAEIYADWFYRPSTFLEIGAFDGIEWSNTWCLAALGWKGVYVEPHPEYAQLCRDNHKDHDVQIVETAVGLGEGPVDLYVRDATSSIVWRDEIAKAFGLDKKEKISVPLTTADAIVDQYWPNNPLCYAKGPDVLVIDVEGAEIQVLQSFNLAHWRPRVVIVETCEGCDSACYRNEQDINPIVEFCDQYFLHGPVPYQKYHVGVENTIFIRIAP